MNTVTRRLRFRSTVAALAASAWIGQTSALQANSRPIAITQDDHHE